MRFTMKKKLCFIPVIAIGASLVACGGGGDKPQPKPHTVSCISSEMRLRDATAYEGMDFSTIVEVNSVTNEEAILPSELTNVTMGGDAFKDYSYIRNEDKKTAKFSIEGKFIKGDIIINDDISHLYTVTWNLDNGEEKIEETYEAGDYPTFKGTTPIKEDSEIDDNYYQTGYVFNGWKDGYNQDIHYVNEDVEYKAQYKEKSVVTRFVLASNSLKNKTFKVNYEGTCDAISWDTGATLVEEEIPADTLEHTYDAALTSEYTVISIFGQVTSVTLSEKKPGSFAPLAEGNEATRCIILGSYINTINSYAFSGLTLLNTVFLPSSLTNVGNDIASSCDLTGKSLVFYSENTVMPTTWDKNWAAVTTSHVQNYGTYYSVHVVGIDTINGYTYVSVNYNGYEELAITGYYGKMDVSGELTIPNTEKVNGVEMPVTAIMYEAFNGNVDLKQITIPDTIDCIGKNSFKGCTQLGGIYITGGGDPKWPSKLEVIEESAFEGCRNLNMDCDFSNTALTTIGTNAFRSSHIKSLKLGKRVTSVASLAFCSAGLLEEVDLSLAVNLTVISESAFEATNLKSFKFPPKVKEIKTSAFSGAITSAFEGAAVVLPKTLTKIDSLAFDGLPTSIALDASLYQDAASIPDGLYNMLGSSGGYNYTIYIYNDSLKQDFLDKKWPVNANYVQKPMF